MINEFAAAMTLAAHIWGVPACGQPTVAVEAYPQGIVSTQVADALEGWADIPGCRVIVTPNGATRTPCTTIVHEWGHLKNGPAHSSNPRNVMFANPEPYWRCFYGSDADPLATFKHGWMRRWRAQNPVV